MKQPLFPLSAFKYDKKIIEIREVVRVEMFAIIHCAVVKGAKTNKNWSLAKIYFV